MVPSFALDHGVVCSATAHPPALDASSPITPVTPQTLQVFFFSLFFFFPPFPNFSFPRANGKPRCGNMVLAVMSSSFHVRPKVLCLRSREKKNKIWSNKTNSLARQGGGQKVRNWAIPRARFAKLSNRGASGRVEHCHLSCCLLGSASPRPQTRAPPPRLSSSGGQKLVFQVCGAFLSSSFPPPPHTDRGPPVFLPTLSSGAKMTITAPGTHSPRKILVVFIGREKATDHPPVSRATKNKKGSDVPSADHRWLCGGDAAKTDEAQSEVVGWEIPGTRVRRCLIWRCPCSGSRRGLHLGWKGWKCCNIPSILFDFLFGGA